MYTAIIVRKNLIVLTLLLVLLVEVRGQTIEQLQVQIKVAHQDTTRLRLYCDLGRLYQKQAMFDSLYRVVQRALPLASKFRSGNYTARLYTLLGLYYRSKGQFDKSIDHFETSVRLFNQIHERHYIGTALNFLSITYTDKGDRKQAINQTLINIDFFIKHHLNDNLLSSYSLLESIYKELKNKELRLYYWNKYYQLAKKSADLDTRIIALQNQALSYEEKGAFAQAWLYRQKELEYARSLNVPYFLINALRDVAANLRQQGRPAEALPYAQRAIQQSTNRDAAQLGISWRELALDYLQLGNYQRALQASRQAVSFIRKSNFDGELLPTLEALALVQESAGKYKAALSTTKQIITQKDSLFNIDKHKAIAQLQETYDLKNKEHTIQLLHKDLQLRRFQRAEQDRKLWQLITGVGILIGLVCSISLLLHRANQTRQQLAQQNQLIESQAQELQDANQLKDQLFAVVGHDLRAPIIGLDYMLRQVQQTSSQAQNWPFLLSQLTERVGQTGRLINNLLYWSLAQQGLLQDRVERLDLNELLTDCISLLSDTIRQKALQINVSGSAGVQVWADERCLQLIIRNLLDNAVKFSPNEGSIDIHCSNEAAGFLLVVTNQISSQSKKLVGTNLGLKTVTELVQRHNGSLTIKQPQPHSWQVSLNWPQSTDNSTEYKFIANL